MKTNELLLGVNIDHVATLRQARGTRYPDPVFAALQVEQAGADSIRLHLREDRRHIQDRDVYLLKERMLTRMNLEMAVTSEMVKIACDVKPEDVCLVPEKREELTTEGGLDVLRYEKSITEACEKLAGSGINVSLFIDADLHQIDAAKRTGVPVIEIHTGHYADAVNHTEQQRLLADIIVACEHADSIGLQVNAGHGLNRQNVHDIARLQIVKELNIGHALIADSVFMGLDATVREYKRLMREARS
ncbi:MAG: pyridoxine 5'-phosphate synthase [Gammaproteobacteria bacterium]|nr:pyridoxine 5'-phosphate synthase [Gammaproteobacteria bacterium]